jgi:hypothetical protein
MTATVTRDPVFALAPEMKLHLSEVDSALVVNSREVSRVFGRRHRLLIRITLETIWVLSKRPDRDGNFRLRADGTIDMTSQGFEWAVLQHTPMRSKRGRKFIHDWCRLVCVQMRECEARTGIHPIVEALKKLGVEPVSFAPEPVPPPPPRPKPHLVCDNG